MCKCNLDSYFEEIRNININDIKNTSFEESCNNDISKDAKFSNYKLKIDKTDKFKLPRQTIDLLFGLYTEEDNCEYSIFYDNTIIKQGFLIKNKITYIPPLPLLSICYVDIFISSTKNIFALCSIFQYYIRKNIAMSPHQIPSFLIREGFIYYDKNQTESCFPLIENNTIEDRIHSMNMPTIYLKKHDLLLTDNDAKIISQNIKLLNMFIDKKIDKKIESISF